MPTEAQMLKCIVLCQVLSNCYRSIQLFRYDSQRKEIFLIAGEQGTIEITIFVTGEWRYDVT
ncbi:MAG: hypothetical protein SAL07_14070 [Oscillatoria sp. PMC 1051.18]|nr:hypothetical protein [Oscillatoria sp. PMC 1050.18]MEC5031019.1 hypothetical protein [Oscillatoria sp. PMC 1051.18]